MFAGEESEKFTSELSRGEVYDHIEECLSPLGHVEIDKRGNIDIRPRSSFENAFSSVEISGYVRERSGRYVVTIEFTVALTALGWVLLILGCFFFLLGLLVLISPIQAKGEVGRAARRAVRDLA